MATIRKKGEYQWHAQVRKRGYPQQTKTFNTKAEAEAWARQVESEMDRGMFISRSEAEGTTVAELLTRYGLEISPRKKTHAAELRRLEQLQHAFGQLTLAGLQSKHIAAWRDAERKRGLAGATIIKSLNLLAHVIETAIKEWGLHIPTNPVRLVSKPKTSRARDRRLMPGELEAVIKHAQSGELAAIFRLAVETAMRRGEILSLQWENIDLKRSIAHLPDTKNGETRTVPLSPAARDVLASLPRRIDGRVFNYTSPDSITQGFEIALRRARKAYEEADGNNPSYLMNLRLHDLRHEATSRLFESKKFDMMEVATITGHKTLSMLKRYTHLRAEDLAKKMG